jgi:hypothetical protein
MKPTELQEADRPLEVTSAMIQAGVQALEEGEPLTYSGLVRSIYLAMAAASLAGSGLADSDK